MVEDCDDNDDSLLEQGIHFVFPQRHEDLTKEPMNEAQFWLGEDLEETEESEMKRQLENQIKPILFQV